MNRFEPEVIAQRVRQTFRNGGRLVLVLVAVLLFFNSFSVVAPGNTGVVFNLWSGSLRTVGQGLAFRIPFVTRVQSYPTALRTYTMVRRGIEGSAQDDDRMDLPTREGQHIRQDISVTFNTSEQRDRGAR